MPLVAASRVITGQMAADGLFDDGYLLLAGDFKAPVGGKQFIGVKNPVIYPIDGF